jgi:hypothetical protein
VASGAAGACTAGASVFELGCAEESEDCCAAALTAASRATVNINFQVRMTFSKFLNQSLEYAVFLKDVFVKTGLPFPFRENS